MVDSLTRMRNIFHRLGPDYETIIQPLMEEPLSSLMELKRQLMSYMAELEAGQSAREFLDLTTARTLAEEGLHLIQAVSGHYTQERHRVLQVAIRYFVLDEDVESDASSIIGFDDDAEVMLIAKEYLASRKP